MLAKLSYLLVLPASIVVGLARFTRFQPGAFEAVLLYIALIFTNIQVTTGLQQWAVAKRARQAGASTAPKAKGKWIGNIDVRTEPQFVYACRLSAASPQILRTFIKRIPHETPGIFFDELADSMGSNTIDMNILNGKNYFTRDPAVIKVRCDCVDSVTTIAEPGVFAQAVLTETENGFLKFEKGPFLDGILGDLLGKGIFVSLPIPFQPNPS